jgi:hypothetical protein
MSKSVINSEEELAKRFEELKRLRAEVLAAEETSRGSMAHAADDQPASPALSESRIRE